ncbi:hypothetical protein YERSI8AC_130210 [Enterobacterales bacterium 8AC]|nr:hypothetical protein YERSI8AC_130210 [Enterobacterales bacterium 8AC]
MVGQVQLEAADPFVMHHACHFVENAVINMLNYAMKTIINHRITGSILMVKMKLMVKVTARRAEPHMIDNSGSATAGGSAGAREKVIATTGDADIDIKMGVNINAAGHYVAAGGINNLAVGPWLNVGCALANDPILDQQILSVLPVAIYQNAVFNQPLHVGTLEKITTIGEKISPSPNRKNQEKGFSSVFWVPPHPNPLPEGEGTGSPHGLAGHQHPHNPEPCAPSPCGRGPG